MDTICGVHRGAVTWSVVLSGRTRIEIIGSPDWSLDPGETRQEVCRCRTSSGGDRGGCQSGGIADVKAWQVCSDMLSQWEYIHTHTSNKEALSRRTRLVKWRTQWGMAHLFWLICSSPIVGIFFLHTYTVPTYFRDELILSKEGKMLGWGGCECLVSNWMSCASVYGQSDTSAVGFTQFAGCQMRLIVLPSAGHSFFSSVSGRETKQTQLWVFSHSWTRRHPLIASLILYSSSCDGTGVAHSYLRDAETMVSHRWTPQSSRATAISRLILIIWSTASIKQLLNDCRRVKNAPLFSSCGLDWTCTFKDAVFRLNGIPVRKTKKKAN